MHVALYVHCFHPEHYLGTETYTLTLARGLAALGRRVTVVAANPPGDRPQGEPILRYEVGGVPVLRIERSLGAGGPARDDYDRPDWLGRHRELLRGLAPDVVHVCHLKHHSLSLLEAARELSLPVFATLTDAYPICFRTTLETAGGRLCSGPSPSRANCLSCGIAARGASGSAAWRWLARQPRRWIAAEVAARAERVLPASVRRDVRAVVDRPDAFRRGLAGLRGALAPTDWLRDAYEAQGFTFPIVVRPFGIDVDRSPKPPPPPGPPRLGYVGQIAPHKAPHLVVEALRRLGPAAPPLQIWGSEAQHPAYARELRARAAGLPVEFRGTFETDRAAAVMAGIDALVLPSSWRENSPLVLLTALATGTPAIVSDVEGLTELVDDGVAGLHFRRGDARDLARVVARLLDEPALLPSLRARARYDRTGLDAARDALALYEAAFSCAANPPDVAGPAPPRPTKPPAQASSGRSPANTRM